jgi:pyruvate,water dikinase
VSYILRFEDCRADDVSRVGGKCASLGALLEAGLPVPPGFAVTTDAYDAHLAASGLHGELAAELGRLDPGDVDALDACSERLRALIEASPIPAEVEQAIRGAYALLCASEGDEIPVAVRSSATAEDLPGASFAGQQDTYLWIVGADAVLAHVRRCWASLYTSRAIAYRHDQAFEGAVLMSVAVQKMVRARSAGVALTLNPVNGDRSKIAIDSSFGLGETVVGGLVTPDSFIVDKVVLEIVKRTISPKQLEIVPDAASRGVVERAIEPERQLEPSLALEEVKAVARLAKQAEQHFGAPQDVEWALEPHADGPVLLQSRPETVWSKVEPAAEPPSQYQTGLSGVLSTLMNPLAQRNKSS